MKKIAAITATAVLALGTLQPAHAILGVGDIVLDPSNLAQNILSAERALEQIQNQLRSLENEGQMLLNDALNLQGLDYSSLNRLRETIAATQRLFDEAQGLSFAVDLVRDQFAQLYPAEYNEALSYEHLDADHFQRWENSREALSTALQLQSQTHQSFAADEGVLADLIERSQSAVGALQAAQATNQLLGLQIRQLMQAQQLEVGQDRAVALEHARTVAAEERARELRRRFMTPAVAYSPAPVPGV
jgi:P-type conjugative transfer protein TrbJ